LQDLIWRIGVPDCGFVVTIPSQWVSGLDWLTALARHVGALIIAGILRKRQDAEIAIMRLAVVERACALRDRVLALSYELQDRYGRSDGAGEAGLPVVCGLRRDMAMADARAALDAHGDWAEGRLAEDVSLIAICPVVEHPRPWARARAA
jgi:hypothetical protein